MAIEKCEAYSAWTASNSATVAWAAGGGDPRAERHHGERQQRRAERDDRGHDEENLVDVAGDDVLLEEHLAAVGDRLEQAERADAVRPEAVLHPRRDPPFEQDQVGDVP